MAMERESHGRVADFMRGTEPVELDKVPVHDGRDFVEKARPPAGADRRPTGFERQLGGCPPRTRKG